MKLRINELEEVVFTRPTDAKKLQLRLQGSVCVQVNAGPLAYANAFLDSSRLSQFPSEKVDELKEMFQWVSPVLCFILYSRKETNLIFSYFFISEFVKICCNALQVNSKVIESDQHEYQDALKRNFQKMCTDLTALLGESVYPYGDVNDSFKRNSQALFNAISGSSHSSSTCWSICR